ncbi:MAG: ABC-type transport auxiliary lipoprotein family protein [Bryobacteraceae bacterium]|jgi:ABC-type uncharacterized transport system auxiliary subunit
MIRTSLVVALLLLASGCVPHKVQYYQLSAMANPVAPAETGPVLLVGRIATPQALQDGRIRYRDGLNAVGAYEYHRWTDPPGIMVKDSLIRVLRAAGKYKSVQEVGSSADGDYTVRGKLLEFSELDGSGIQTRVSLDLELREVRTGRLVWNEVFTHDDPVQAKTVPDVVQSLDRNLQVVLGDAASGIGSYVAAHPRGR